MDQEPVQIEIGSGVSNVENMIMLQMNVLSDSEDSDKESDSARSVSLHLADGDTGSDIEQYLNIWKVGMVPPHFCLWRGKVVFKEKYHLNNV